MLRTLHPVAIDLARVDQYQGLGPFIGIGLAVKRGAESPTRSSRGS